MRRGAEPRVRGLLVTRQRELLRRLAGPRYPEALARVAPAVRDEYESTGVLSWCAQSTARSVTAAVADVIGRDRLEVVREIVAVSTREALRGPWAVFLTVMSSDESIVRRAAVLFEKAFDRGKLNVVPLGDGVAEITLEGWPDANELDIESLVQGMETLLECVGRRSTVTVSPNHGMPVFLIRRR